MDREMKEAIERYDLAVEQSQLNLEFDDEESEITYERFEPIGELYVSEGNV